jgi:hypothetical protein
MQVDERIITKSEFAVIRGHEGAFGRTPLTILVFWFRLPS